MAGLLVLVVILTGWPILALSATTTNTTTKTVRVTAVVDLDCDVDRGQAIKAAIEWTLDKIGNKNFNFTRGSIVLYYIYCGLDEKTFSTSLTEYIDGCDRDEVVLTKVLQKTFQNTPNTFGGKTHKTFTTNALPPLQCQQFKMCWNYFLNYKKNIRFDFDDELKIGDVRYKHLT